MGANLTPYKLIKLAHEIHKEDNVPKSRISPLWFIGRYTAVFRVCLYIEPLRSQADDDITRILTAGSLYVSC